MPLLNYTTGIEADKSAMEISRCLSKHGATAIMTEYDPDGYVSALSFQIKLGEGKAGFKLPCDWKPILTILQNDRKVPRSKANQEQAIRTAWRIVKDWVEAQMALVETNMVSTQEVFLPYMVMKGGRTLAQTVQDNPKFLLEAP